MEAANKNKLLYRIQSLKFALAETNLFLDGHPKNTKALKYFNRLKGKLDEARAQYEAAFGPLTALANVSETNWHWVAAPWPWEPED